jgi:hypothetical protein
VTRAPVALLAAALAAPATAETPAECLHALMAGLGPGPVVEHASFVGPSRPGHSVRRLDHRIPAPGVVELADRKSGTVLLRFTRTTDGYRFDQRFDDGRTISGTSTVQRCSEPDGQGVRTTTELIDEPGQTDGRRTMRGIGVAQPGTISFVFTERPADALTAWRWQATVTFVREAR